MNISRLALSVVFGAAMCGFAMAQKHGDSGSHESHSSGSGSHYSSSHNSFHSSGGSGFHSYSGSNSGSSHEFRGFGGSSSFGNNSFHGWGSRSNSSTTNQFWRGNSNADFRSFNRTNEGNRGFFNSGYQRDQNESFSNRINRSNQNERGNFSWDSRHDSVGDSLSRGNQDQRGNSGWGSRNDSFGSNHFGVNTIDAGQGGHGDHGNNGGHWQGRGGGGNGNGDRYQQFGHSNYHGSHNFNGGYHGEVNHGSHVQVIHSSIGRGFSFGDQPYTHLGDHGHDWDHHGDHGDRGDHGWREGYRQYHRDWDDSHFFFGFYLFSPWDTSCVVSPWYYYPCLPPYLPANRVIYLNDNANWYAGSDYFFNPDADPNSYGNVDLNYSLNNLVNVFDNGDEYGLGELVEKGSQVGVYNDGKYMYSVQSDDFYQMMLDNVHGVENVNFSITHVRITDGGAVVDARHEFTDPDGGNDTVYQEYRLRYDDGHYVIQDFNTSKYPGGARTFF